MYSKRKICLAMAIFIVAAFLLGLSPTYHFADDFARNSEIRNVQEALASYFAEHHRYPESLDILFEQSLLRRDSQKHTDYAPEHDYGSYIASYKDEEIVMCFGPPLSEETQNAKLMRLQKILMKC